MDKYDSGKMRSCAQDILAELKNYTTAKDDADGIVTGLRNNWQDKTNEAYSQKYNAEAKVAAENVQKLMEEFAETLTKTAEALEKVHSTAQNDING